MIWFLIWFSVLLISDTHTHTHTHTDAVSVWLNHTHSCIYICVVFRFHKILQHYETISTSAQAAICICHQQNSSCHQTHVWLESAANAIKWIMMRVSDRITVITDTCSSQYAEQRKATMMILRLPSLFRCVLLIQLM